MAKKAKELSALEVNRLRSEGMHAVGGVAGLHLRGLPTGGRTWILRVVVGSRRRELGLGGFPDVPLAQAREKAREARDNIKQGVDPVELAKEKRSALKRQQAMAVTFSTAAEQYIASKAHEWRNAKHGQQWQNTLTQYAYPVVGNMMVKEVQQEHVLSILKPIWVTKAETASRLRQRIEGVLDWATASKLRTGENPARWRGHLDKLLPKTTKIKTVRHHPALPSIQMAAFYSELQTQPGIAALALRFLILTNVRSKNVREARWEEVDRKLKIWTIPAQKMKAEREHTVPLSDEAMSLLEQISATATSGLVFPAPRGGEFSDMALTAVVRRMNDAREKSGAAAWQASDGRSIVVHGFRSTFRDWAGAKTQHAREVIEHAMAHQLADKAEAAYARDTLLEKRRLLMSDWGTHCTLLPTAGNIVALRAASGAS